MFELLSTVLKYVLVIVVYFFIYRIVRLIQTDIRMMSGGEATASLLPHLKLLTPLEGKGSGRSVAEIYPLVRAVTVLGRGKDCGIVLPDPYISTEHLKIEKEKNQFYLEDLRSANGTLLNGVKLETRRELRDGDRISMGRIDLIFSEGGR